MNATPEARPFAGGVFRGVVEGPFVGGVLRGVVEPVSPYFLRKGKRR